MLTIVWVILFILFFAGVVYFSMRKQKKGKAEYREPDEPEKNDV